MWVDGYWTGRLESGYPETYFADGKFTYPWEKSVETKKKVYVNAWQYDTGSGFDWYLKPEQADAAFEKEKENAQTPTLADEGWSAYRFDVEVEVFNEETAAITINDYIFENLDELCTNATLKLENKLPLYGCVLSEIKAQQ